MSAKQSEQHIFLHQQWPPPYCCLCNHESLIAAQATELAGLQERLERQDDAVLAHDALQNDVIEAVALQQAALAQVDVLEEEIAALKEWVSDLQSGMFINCVYCGHRYGPRETTPMSAVEATPTMAETLKAHVEQCPKHPMSALRAEVERLKGLAVRPDEVPADPRVALGYQREQWAYWEQRAREWERLLAIAAAVRRDP